jgi:RNA polymerase sigma factor (TIGR02999 family)
MGFETSWPMAAREGLATMSDVKSILSDLEQGDPRGAAQLLPLVYDELRKLATRKLAREAPGQTLQATALVHEAYLRLVGAEDPGWNSRGHFFAAAAEAMRRILVEHARRKGRTRHGGEAERVEIELAALPTRMAAEELVALNDALEELERQDPRKARLVTLRYFGGMTLEEAAAALGVSRVTAHRDWTFARAWLRDRTAGG